MTKPRKPGDRRPKSGLKKADDDLERIGHQVEDIARGVGDIVHEVGGAVGEIVQSVTGSMARRRQMSPAEKLLKRAKRRRKDWIGHRNAYVATNIGLAAINVATGFLAGDFTPWFVFPAIGWGIGLGIHTLNYRSWLTDKKDDIERARLEVAAGEPAQEVQRAAIAPSAPDVARDAKWADLVRRCRIAVAESKQSLAKSDNTELLVDEVAVRLDDGLKNVEQLASGAVTLKRAMQSVVPEGTEGLSERIAELDAKIANATDPSLTDVYRSNRALLDARSAKLKALGQEHERMQARAEGFLLAVENIRLDASRLSTPGQIDTLTEPLKQLSDEVAILRDVESELLAMQTS